MFSGQLIKVGNYAIPLNLIKSDTYQVTPQSRQDLDSFRDGNGVLHRTVLDHTISKIEFETMPMKESEWIGLMNAIHSNMSNVREKKCRLTYYNPINGQYNMGDFYIPDIVPTFNIKEGVVKFSPVRLAFIEY